MVQKKRDFHQNYTTIVVFFCPYSLYILLSVGISSKLQYCSIVETRFSCNSTILGVEQILAFWQNLPEFLSQPDNFNAVVSLNWNGDDLITTFIDFKFLHTQQGVISIIFQYLK